MPLTPSELALENGNQIMTTTIPIEPVERSPIRELTASVINKIAAGEVIERPASVVKELLENSVDSGATKIEVSIENGGIDLIRICDNGCGIPKEELNLAVTSHATSKIKDADELFRVATFGFRGEALASIAEISQFTIRSRTAKSNGGYELIVNGGQAEPIEACGMPEGTIIEVRNLFFNTPVRRKFMRTPQTERGHVAEAFTRIALANPDVHLSLVHNGKTQQELPPVENWSQRIADFFGPEIADNLIPVSSSNGEVSVEGYVVNPSVNRANNRMQYLFLNGRYIRDRSLQHALSESYRGLLMTGRYPITFLRMDMPPQLVDVNVHPAKLEVRFQDGGKLYSQLLSTIRNKFLSTDLTAKADLTSHGSRGSSASALATTPVAPSSPSFRLQTGNQETQERIEFPSSAPSRDWTAAPMAIGGRQTPNFQPFPGSGPNSSSGAIGPNTPLTGPHSPAPSLAQSNEAINQPPQSSYRISALQVHNTYLICETDAGMEVIDQHALHERIIYEQLRGKVLSGKLEKQKLLVPEPVALPAAEAAIVLEQTELLAKIGITVEPFGGDTVLVSAYPAMLANQNPAETLKSIIDLLMSEAHEVDQRDLVDELLHMISCKAAVKAGDKLTPEEINDLLEHRDYCQDAHHCPHGRPTALVFSREELDKRFKRI